MGRRGKRGMRSGVKLGEGVEGDRERKKKKWGRKGGKRGEGERGRNADG